jgi:hypothetical protein
MEEKSDSLMDELNDLKNEVKMLRAIVQSLMYVITEDQELDADIEMIGDERDQYGRPATRNYVS